MKKQLSLLNMSNNGQRDDNTLFILHNGNHEKMTPKQIFNNRKYTELRAVTYSATGSFVTKYLSNFHKIYIIEGLQENKQMASMFANMNQVVKNTLNTVSDGLLNNNLIKFLENLNNKSREKIVKHDFDLRVPTDRVIHEKFYLLSNPITHNTRILVGSANLSFRALSNRSKQNEGLLVIDNKPKIYNKMLHHFYELYGMTSSYLSNVTRRILGKQIHEINPKHPKQQPMLTKNEKKEIKKAVLPSAIKQIEKQFNEHKLSPAVKASVIKSFKHLTDKSPKLKKQMIQEISKNMALVDVAQNTVSRSHKVLKFKNLRSIERSIPSHLKKYRVHIHHTGTTKHVNFNVPMVFDQPEDRQYGTDTGLRINKNGIKVPLGHPVSNDAIKRDLEIINVLMKSYKKYAYRANTEYQSRAMEAILYALTCMFLSDIRNQVTPGLIRDIPLFFIIGGARKTGKTSLLKFIIKMLGIYPLDNHNVPDIRRYALLPIDGSGNVGKKTGHINFIHDNMTSEFVTPLAVNEIDDSFNENHMGTNLIVRTMGEFQDYPDRQFSAMLGVTNNSHYDLGQPAKDGRSYYLNFGKHIPATPSGSRLIQKLTSSMDNSLFLDFAMQFSNLLSKGIIKRTYPKAYSHGKFDFLYWSRKIMCHEYHKVGMKVPDFMPTTIYDDSTSAGKGKWRDFYLAHYQQFEVDPTNHNRMEVSTNIFKNGRYNNNAGTYMNMLPEPQVCLNTSNKTNEIILNRKNFFKYINLNEKRFLREEEQHHIHHEAKVKFDSHKAEILYKKKEQQILGNQHGFIYKLFHDRK